MFTCSVEGGGTVETKTQLVYRGDTMPVFGPSSTWHVVNGETFCPKHAVFLRVAKAGTAVKKGEWTL